MGCRHAYSEVVAGIENDRGVIVLWSHTRRRTWTFTNVGDGGWEYHASGAPWADYEWGSSALRQLVETPYRDACRWFATLPEAMDFLLGLGFGG